VACPAWNNTAKPKRNKIKLINKRVDNTHRVVFGNIIFQAFGKQSDLAAVFAFNKTLHRKTLSNNIQGPTTDHVLTQPGPNSDVSG